MKPASSTTQGIDTPSMPWTPSESASEWAEESLQQLGKPFPQAKVAFAVDVSGSTQGWTILAEKHFITTVSELINPRPRFDAKILPWDDTAYGIRGVSLVNTLKSEGGTNPGVLLKSAPCRDAILDSDLWFLMTDGLINDGTRSAFATNLAKNGVHGTNCVIVIFGDPAAGPGACDISVGISVFAVVPNCAFLFYNTRNGEIRLFQTRGAFNSLLKGQPPPVFDKSSKWGSLPLVDPSDFANIQLPPHQKLNPDEVALQGDLIINLEDLFSNRLSLEKVSSILDNEDNLSAVVMTSRTRNQQDAFQHWIQQQTIAVDDPLHRPRDDIGRRAQSVFTEVIDLLRRGRAPSEKSRQKLRQAYLDNMKRFVREIQKNKEDAQERRGVIQSASAWSDMDFNHSPALCSPVPRSAAPLHPHSPQLNKSCVSAPAPPAAPLRERPQRPHQYYAAYVESYKSWEDSIRDPRISRLLYTQGFQSTGGAFRGNCPICGGREMKMAFLFRDVPTSTSTVGFPPPRRRTRLAFPFAMGNFHEMDVLSSTLCCDPCSMFAVRTTSSMDPEETISTAIPLVRYAENKTSISDALDKIFSLRFTEGDLPLLLLSVLLTARPRFAAAAASERPAAAAAATAVSAIDWAVKDLLHTIPVLKELSESFSQPGAKTPLWPLAYVLKESFTDETHPPTQPLMCYPLPGFIVLLAASKNAGVRSKLRELAVLRRFLFLLVEGFCRARASIPIKGTSDAAVLSMIFGNILWEQRQSRRRQGEEGPGLPPGFGIDAEHRKPILSVPIALLAETAILSEQNYGTMQRAEEFGALQIRFVAGVNRVVGLFLHALYRTAVKAPGLGAWEMFEEIMRSSAMVEGVARVRELGEKEAKGLYDELMDVFESSS